MGLVWDWVPEGFPKKQALPLGLGKQVQSRDSSHKSNRLEVKSRVLIWTLPLNCCVIFCGHFLKCKEKGGWGFVQALTLIC